MSDPVKAARLGDDGWRLTLDRPDQANALDAVLVDSLLARLREATTSGVRLVVLEGGGKNFCGGFDLSDVETQTEGDLLLRFVRIEQLLQALWDAPFVSIVCTHGAAFGAGADLVAAGSYRIGAPGCRFRFPGYRFGIALGTRRLGALLGEQSARHLLLGNVTLDGDGARANGLLTHFEERDEWERIVAGIEASLAGLSGAAMAELLGNLRQDRGAGDRDLASLVRSAAAPGIHQRIAAYRESVSRR